MLCVSLLYFILHFLNKFFLKYTTNNIAYVIKK